jgi:hypothetical protein
VRSLRLLAAAGALAVVLGACAGATPAPSQAPPASPVDGVIVAVDASGLSEVRGFTLRLADGSTMTFRLGQLENPTQFPPGHLKEHQATSIAVRVFFVAGPDGPVVYRLEDAPGASPVVASPAGT